MSKPLKIAVIAHAMRAAGSLSVCRNLVNQICQQRPNNSLLFTIPDGIDIRPKKLISNHQFVTFRRGSLIGRWMWDEFKLPRIIKHFAPDLVLALGNRGLTRTKWPQALLCHDAHYFYPMTHFPKDTLLWKCKFFYQRHRMRKDLKNTNLLLCQTKTALNRMCDWYQYRGITALCPNAVSAAATPFHPNSPSVTAKRGNLTLLCLSRYYSHKNLELLADTFERFREQLSDVVVWITIAPDQHPGAKRLLDRIESQKLGSQIVNLGPLDQHQIAAHYEAVDGLILPTTLESFSGSYVEAMQFGRAIVTSDLDFAHEVCGPAAEYFNPWNCSSLFEAIQRFRNPTLRQKLVQAGQTQLSRLGNSWSEIASSLLWHAETLVDQTQDAGQRVA